MAPPEKRKRGTGKKKIEIKPIEKTESRQICFSKRRQGLFKKANELSILCGAEIAVLVFSPASKPFSFGHPSVEAVSNRFLHGAEPTAASLAATSRCEQIKSVLAYFGHLLEVQRIQRDQLEAVLRDSRESDNYKPFWWDADILSMGPEELTEFNASLMQIEFALSKAQQQCGLPEPVVEAREEPLSRSMSEEARRKWPGT